ncbi:thioesterase family protein [Alicyclobacillus dauci]|uniref:Thioesterase n=1 Tax=Alicyclobacillus dauci TaxID=1475485 RepID=A0ABY6YY48_9BACL|nr:thioesterase [Alicyclobacillus dauci]WAH35178.1 thioesterase [Alicyclobacillus dauci]
MKPGLSVGHQERLDVTVTDDMFPAFEGTSLHPTLSTVTMVHYMEWVSRLVILPYLEEGEEGIGGGIAVHHLAPAPEGKTVTFVAETTEVAGNKVVCRVWAEHDRARVGEGTVTQFILPKEKIHERIAAMI